MEAHRWHRRSCRSTEGAMTTKNGRRRAGKRAAGVGIASRGAYATSSSSAWGGQCTSLGERVAQSSAGIAWPFLAHGEAGSYPPRKASDKGQEDESRTTDSGVRWNERPETTWLLDGQQYSTRSPGAVVRLRRCQRRHHPQHLPALHDMGHQVAKRHDRKRSRAVLAAARG